MPLYQLLLRTLRAFEPLLAWYLVQRLWAAAPLEYRPEEDIALCVHRATGMTRRFLIDACRGIPGYDPAVVPDVGRQALKGSTHSLGFVAPVVRL